MNGRQVYRYTGRDNVMGIQTARCYADSAAVARAYFRVTFGVQRLHGALVRESSE